MAARSRALRQPKEALTPSAFSVQAAEQWALDRAATLPIDAFRLLALWSVSYLVQAEPGRSRKGEGSEITLSTPWSV